MPIFGVTTEYRERGRERRILKGEMFREGKGQQKEMYRMKKSAKDRQRESNKKERLVESDR